MGWTSAGADSAATPQSWPNVGTGSEARKRCHTGAVRFISVKSDPITWANAALKGGGGSLKVWVRVPRDAWASLKPPAMVRVVIQASMPDPVTWLSHCGSCRWWPIRRAE